MVVKFVALGSDELGLNSFLAALSWARRPKRLPLTIEVVHRGQSIVLETITIHGRATLSDSNQVMDLDFAVAWMELDRIRFPTLSVPLPPQTILSELTC